MTQEFLNEVIDICEARIDYNQALVDTMSSLDLREDVKEFCIETGGFSSFQPGYAEIYRQNYLNITGTDELKRTFISEVLDDQSFYRDLLSRLESRTIDFFSASIMTKGQLNAEETKLKPLLANSSKSDKFELYSLRAINKLLFLCLSKEEQVILNYIKFQDKSSARSYFDINIFQDWLTGLSSKYSSIVDKVKKENSHESFGQEILALNEALNDLYTSITLARTKVIQSYQSRVVSSFEAHYQGFLQSFKDSRFIDSLDRLKSQIERVENKIKDLSQEQIQEETMASSPEEAPKKKSNKKKKKKKKKKQVGDESGEFKDGISADEKQYLGCEDEDELSSKITNSSDHDADIFEQEPFVKSRSKKERREEHENSKNLSRCRKAEKADSRMQRQLEARRQAEEQKDFGMQQYMSGLSQEKENTDDREFIVTQDRIVRNYDSLLELFSNSVKEISFNKVKSLISGLGGCLENKSGGSHYEVKFNERLKGFVNYKKTVVGGVAKPHGKSSKGVAGLNLRLLKTSLKKVLPENWIDLLENSATVHSGLEKCSYTFNI